ncbi:MAG: hypothetical protein GY745_00160 [Actinomycetia bacterium]|nr:hypothetical protein [Actinomycetes bacterium]
MKGRAGPDEGSVALGHVAALGGLCLFVVLGAQILLWGYGRGAVRAAAQEAVADGSRPAAGADSCEQRFATVIDGLLGGSLGDGVGSPSCRVGPDQVILEVEVRFRGWLPGVPDWSQRVVAVAPRHPLASAEWAEALP